MSALSLLIVCMPSVENMKKFGALRPHKALVLEARQAKGDYYLDKARLKITLDLKRREADLAISVVYEQGAGNNWSLLAATGAPTHAPLPTEPGKSFSAQITSPSDVIPTIAFDCVTREPVDSVEHDAGVVSDGLVKRTMPPAAMPSASPAPAQAKKPITR